MRDELLLFRDSGPPCHPRAADPCSTAIAGPRGSTSPGAPTFFLSRVNILDLGTRLNIPGPATKATADDTACGRASFELRTRGQLIPTHTDTHHVAACGQDAQKPRTAALDSSGRCYCRWCWYWCCCRCRSPIDMPLPPCRARALRIDREQQQQTQVERAFIPGPADPQYHEPSPAREVRPRTHGEDAARVAYGEEL